MAAEPKQISAVPAREGHSGQSSGPGRTVRHIAAATHCHPIFLNKIKTVASSKRSALRTTGRRLREDAKEQLALQAAFVPAQ